MRLIAMLGFGALLLVGCGDDGQLTGGGGSDEGGGGSDSGGSDHGGGGSDEGGGGGSAECDAFLDNEPPVQTVEIIIENNTDEIVYLGQLVAGCDAGPFYEVESVEGDPVKAFLGSCELSCEGLALGGCECAADCAQPLVIQIDPGGTYRAFWTQLTYVPTEMPAECYADEGCVTDTCPNLTIPSTDLVFLVDGYAALADCQTADCTCDGGTEGSCIVEGAMLVEGPAVTAQTQWTLFAPDLTIVFE